MKLKDKVVVVAGSGRGTGRVIALEVAKEGAAVITAARTAGAAKGVAEEIRNSGGRALGLEVDLATEDDPRLMIEHAVNEFGRIDSLIYSAAYEHQMRFMKLTVDHWDQMIDTNLRGYFIAAQAAAKSMIDLKIRGTIVAIASTAGFVAFPNSADYCASKGGVVALTKAMAIDLAFYGIRVNAVAPGFIQSDVVEAGGSDEVLNRIKSFIPSKRFAAKEDIAKSAIFLACSESDYANGSVFMLDGGLTLGNLP